MHRVVSVSQAKITDPDGRFLVQLASFREDTVQVRVQLLDVQPSFGESIIDALVQLVDDHFPLMECTFDERRLDRRVTDGSPVATLTLRKLLVVDLQGCASQLGREVDTKEPSIGKVSVVTGSSDGKSMVYKWCDEEDFAFLTTHAVVPIVENAVRSAIVLI
uniref:Uncharacterized protein n=1 Tax=Noctiluca scintillans TaxID=2966 RepID=A0A7S1EYE0_NOCSC